MLRKRWGWVTSTISSGSSAASVSHGYDDDFRVTGESVSVGSVQSFTYDQDGLLVQAGPVAIGRDAANGLPISTTAGTVSTALTYNGFGELSSQSATVGSSPLYSETFSRDKLGRITQRVETIQGTTTTYNYLYDLAGRLEQVLENGAVTATYAYDANGSRLSKTSSAGVEAGTYDTQDRLLTAGTRTYGYDLAGDLVSRLDSATGETTGYVYDALGNLVEVVLPTTPTPTTIDYVIDGQNRRVGKKVNGVLVQGWLYRDSLNPVVELDGAGNVVAQFVYGAKPNVPSAMIQGGATYRILSDHLGSVRLVVNASTGVIAQRIDYDEFGNVTLDTNPGFQPFGFAGGLYDSETGLTRFGARDYDSEAGRWTAKDPIRFAGGDANLYGYVVGDPVNLLDSFGLRTINRKISRSQSQRLIESVNKAAQQGTSTIPLSDLLGIAGLPAEARERIDRARGDVRLVCKPSEDGQTKGTFVNEGEPISEDIPGAPVAISIDKKVSGDITTSESEVDLNHISGVEADVPGPFNPDIDRIRITSGNVEITF